jgi:hypothetical protein
MLFEHKVFARRQQLKTGDNDLAPHSSEATSLSYSFMLQYSIFQQQVSVLKSNNQPT